MSESRPEPDRITFYELHDARLDSMAVGFDGTVVLKFGHLAVYFSRADGDCDVWSCAAEFVMAGVTGILLEGKPDLDQYVSEGDLYDASDDPLPVPEPRCIGAGRRLRMLLSSCVTVEVQFGGISVRNLAPIEFLEVWRGPLAG